MLVRFVHHAPHGTQIARYEELRCAALHFAHVVSALCPECREQSLSITAIESAVMWANAGIARREEKSSG